jgi:hypothetical protein
MLVNASTAAPARTEHLARPCEAHPIASTPTTRRHPRTLEEAFGPYARGRASLRPRLRRLPWAGVILRLLCLVLGLAVVAHLIAQAI